MGLTTEDAKALRQLARDLRAGAADRQAEADRRLAEMNDWPYAEWAAKRVSEDLACADEIDARLATIEQQAA